MQENEIIETTEQEATAPALIERRFIDIPGVPPVKLQTLDLARHIGIAPDGTRYVVATFDEARLGHPFASAVYPQQNGYLTLVRLPLCEIVSQTAEEAIAQHIKLVQVIQQGQLRSYLQSL